METSGFYKNIDEYLSFAPNSVIAPQFEMHRETKDEYTYPVDGWYWFDTQEEAEAFLKVSFPKPEDFQANTTPELPVRPERPNPRI